VSRAGGRRGRAALAAALAIAAAAGFSLSLSARPGAARAGAGAGPATTTRSATTPLQVRIARPRIRWAPIPFGAARRRETAAYARRHYGLDSWRIRGPHVIVEHFTATESLAPVRSTFAADRPDPELGELPGTCSHFVVARDGTIYQYVRLSVMCRHTVGLNWTAIGIEHVGTSDAEVLADRAQRTASLRLTLWLMQRYGIRLRDVIGHAESLRSPYHRERYRAWRCQTHGDWSHGDMVRYRRLLRAEARRAGAAELAPAAEVRGPTGSTPGC
jgi:N-acetylmuramoyl-L-alanine amidase-like protein